jgi:hypothetical protein
MDRPERPQEYGSQGQPLIMVPSHFKDVLERAEAERMAYGVIIEAERKAEQVARLEALKQERKENPKPKRKK